MCYSLHPNLPILWQSVTKIIETHYTFIKKVHKKTLDLLKITQNPPSPWLDVVPSLKKPCEVVKTRNELPICNQHWIRGRGRRVSQFLSLIVDLETLGPCNSEPLKQWKNSHSQMFFKIGSLKNFTIFTGIHLYWGLFLTYFFEKRLLYRCFLWILQNS